MFPFHVVEVFLEQRRDLPVQDPTNVALSEMKGGSQIPCQCRPHGTFTQDIAVHTMDKVAGCPKPVVRGEPWSCTAGELAVPGSTDINGEVYDIDTPVS